MAHSLSAERDAWVEHRTSLKDVADKTIVALNAVKAEQADNANANLTILAGVFTVAAGALTIPVTGGVSTAAVGAGVATIAAAVVTVGAGAVAVQDPKRKEVPLGDDTVSGVLLNMASAGGTLNSDVQSVERDICDGLQSLYDRMTDNSSQEREADIPDDELPKGSHVGQYGEKSWTPQQKFVIPRPSMVADSDRLPDPPVKT